MRPKKNLFSGSLGKTQKPGGSPFMTTPCTRALTTPSYVIDIPSIPATWRLVCCSLNRLLWLYKADEGDSYSVVALKWNETKGKLEYAASVALPDSEAPAIRGIDWILLENTIVQVVNEPPYILTKKLFDLSEDSKFCYSLIRSDRQPLWMSYASWGKRFDNGNDEGRGCLDAKLIGPGVYPKGKRIMEACYSTLPSVGDWNIIEDFLVRRPSSPEEDSTGNAPYHYCMKQLRPLIPLEYYRDGMVVYGTGYHEYRRGIQLAFINGQIWGRGLVHTGRVSILPATFDESGQPQEFYLYIDASGGYRQKSSNFNRLVTNDVFLATGVTALQGTSEINFISEKGDPLKSGYCQTAATHEIFLDGEWYNPRPDDEGKCVLDTRNGVGLALGKNGVTIFSGDAENKTIIADDYSCPGMSEWIAPASQVEEVGKDHTLSSFDNGVLMTTISTGFDRLILPRKNLSPACGVFDTKSMEAGGQSKERCFFLEEREGKKEGGEAITQIGVHEIIRPNGVVAPVTHIPWEDIYRDAINIKLVNYAQDNGTAYLPDLRLVEGPLSIKGVSQTGKTVIFKGYAIDPESGKIIPKEGTFNLDPYYAAGEPDAESVSVYIRGSLSDDMYYAYNSNMDECFGVSVYSWKGGGHIVKHFTIPFEEVFPGYVSHWKQTGSYPNYSYEKHFGVTMERAMYFPTRTIPYPTCCYPNFIFREAFTGTPFFVKVTSAGYALKNGYMTGIMAQIAKEFKSPEFFSSTDRWTMLSTGCYDATSLTDNGIATRMLFSFAVHVPEKIEGDIYHRYKFHAHIFVFRVELNPAAFDFNAEREKGRNS